MRRILKNALLCLMTASMLPGSFACATEAIAAAGKSVTVSADGLVVISATPVTDEAVLTTLYRALM